MARGQLLDGDWVLGPADQPSKRLRIRIQVLLTALLVSTNVVGAVIVVAITFLVTPGGGPNSGYLTALAIAVPVYVGVAVVIGATAVTVSALRALRWSIEDQEPSIEQRRTTLGLPWRMTLIQLVLWLGGVATFTILAIILQPEAVLGVVFAVGIAGMVVCAIAYLFTEFALRPIAARALQGRASADEMGAGVQRRMLVFWGLGTGAPVLGLVVAALAAISRDETSVVRLASTALGLAGVVLLFGMLVTVLNARAVVSPIVAVQGALERVKEGDLDVEVRVDDGTELGLLQSGFNEMVRGLREREQIRDLFGRHVGQAVAKAATDGNVELGGETRIVSVLMIDLVGSTTYAATRSPADVVAMLNRFFAVIVEEVDQHGGLVNKFMGDAVLAIFGAPTDLDDHAGAALATARRIVVRLADEVPEIGAGIGVSTGQAVAGNVGHQSRFEYTVIGDAVNAAARLTELAKDVDGRVLVATASVTSADEDERRHWRAAGSPVLRGRDEPTPTSHLIHLAKPSFWPPS